MKHPQHNLSIDLDDVVFFYYNKWYFLIEKIYKNNVLIFIILLYQNHSEIYKKLNSYFLDKK